MVTLEESSIVRLMELVVPYVSDMGYIESLVRSHQGRDTNDLIAELDRQIEDEDIPSKRTDLRILRNSLERL